MGGDFAPVNEVAGAVAAMRDRDPSSFEIVFVGRENDIKAELAKHDTKNLNYSIVNATDVVGMHDDPASVYRSRKESSLYKGIDLQAKGYVDAFMSAGNTGAVMSVATLSLGRIKGVSRPTIGSFIPTSKNGHTLVLDVGANVDSKPRFLYEFAVMGSIYTRRIRSISLPRVGLLNIGEERNKGSETVLKAHELLEASSLEFIGNVEGGDILNGHADVVVCDGFTGNIVLKFAESFLTLFKAKVRSYAERGLLNKLAVAAIRPLLKRILTGLDYEEYGGVPLLGVNGVVIIGHGRNSARAMHNALLLAESVVKNKINDHIHNALNPPSLSQVSYEKS